MMKYILSFLLFAGGVSQAQILTKNSQVKDKPDGSTILSLNEQQEVYSFDPEDGWFKIRKIAWVPRSSIDEEGTIQPGTELSNWEGQPVGKTIEEVKAIENRPGKERQTRDRVEVVVEGYLYKFNIDRTTIPEEEVFEFLNKDKRNQRFDIMKPLMDTFGFEEENAGDLKVMVLLEKNRTLAPDKVFRMMLIFRGESMLVAALTRDHDFPVDEAKGGTEKQMNVLYTWFVKPNPRMKAPIEEIMWTYLPL